MTDNPTDDQIEAARGYDALLVPALFDQWPPHIFGAAQLQPGATVLDVATGTGVLADYVQRHIGPEGRVEAIDASPAMLKVAEQKNASVTWSHAVAEELPYSDSTFTNVVSQFGMMFFTDRVQSIREMVRVVEPGGHLAIAVWASLEAAPGYAAEVELFDRMLGAAAADAARAPFALGDTDEFNRLFQDSGVCSVTLDTASGRAYFPSVRQMVEADLRGWLPVMGVDLAEDQIESTLDAAENALAEFITETGEVVFDISAHILSGSRAS
jgi:ubiquinone/menaquinone biosynthesis C-methylase UbiE